MKSLGKFFWSYFYYPNSDIFTDSELKSDHIWSLVQVFYAFSLYIAFAFFQRLHAGYATAPFDPLWPAFLVRLINFDSAKMILAYFNIGAALLALFNPKARIFRGLAFIAMLSVCGLLSSYGKIGHVSHLLLFALLGLSILDKNSSKNNVVAFLSVQRAAANHLLASRILETRGHALSALLRLSQRLPLEFDGRTRRARVFDLRQIRTIEPNGFRFPSHIYAGSLGGDLSGTLLHLGSF